MYVLTKGGVVQVSDPEREFYWGSVSARLNPLSAQSAGLAGPSRTLPLTTIRLCISTRPTSAPAHTPPKRTTLPPQDVSEPSRISGTSGVNRCRRSIAREGTSHLRHAAKQAGGRTWKQSWLPTDAPQPDLPNTTVPAIDMMRCSWTLGSLFLCLVTAVVLVMSFVSVSFHPFPVFW
ncbi:hypothetical protein C8T65DRAFT_663734 [Cerioporus squamosus]|nr:hypothetical protein C8T65DRAFT_663734 [Cerioporus squamosus]